MKKLGTSKNKKNYLITSGIAIILSIFGLIMVYDASSVSAFHDFGNKYYYLQEQLKWFFMGIIGMYLASKFDYRNYKKIAFALIVISILLLIAVFFPVIGIKAYGAHRWLNIGILNLQPAELTKLTLIIYLAAWMSSKNSTFFVNKVIPFLGLCGILIGLIMLEPDMGTTVVIIATSITMYFLAGAPLWHFLGMIPIMLTGGLLLVLKSPYRIKRLTTFLDPSSDPQGASYHIRQVLLALGAGGLWGIGLGKSRQKYEYLPEAMTDSIFAVIAEEIGFIGGVFLLACFLFFIHSGFKIAKKAPDRFGQLLAVGISSWIAIQTFINIGAMVALLPLTGVPLPFISYGGSSLIIVLCAVGILTNIAKQESGVK